MGTSASVTPDSFAWRTLDGVLFDLDGVITPTAEVHERAWASLFEDYDYGPDDYLEHIDGKPRLIGVADFLSSRGITLPDGSADDAPGTQTVAGFGNQKNQAFMGILEDEGIEAYQGSIATLDLLDDLAVPYAIVSSSRNATTVLAAAGIAERFDTVIDGLYTLERDLPGKPHPAGYLAGATALGISPQATAVVEDAVSGVEAGVAGAFMPVIGVARSDNHRTLTAAGATFVIDDLADLLPKALAAKDQTGA